MVRKTLPTFLRQSYKFFSYRATKGVFYLKNALFFEKGEGSPKPCC
jgi:hypothetical protein